MVKNTTMNNTTTIHPFLLNTNQAGQVVQQQHVMAQPQQVKSSNSRFAYPQGIVRAKAHCCGK